MIEVTKGVDAETQGFVSRSSFLLRESTSTFGEGVVSNHQRHERPPLFSDEPHPNGFDSPLPLDRKPSRWKPAPLQQVRGTHPQLNWRLPNTSKLSRQIKDKIVRTKSKLGFPMKH